MWIILGLFLVFFIATAGCFGGNGDDDDEEEDEEKETEYQQITYNDWATANYEQKNPNRLQITDTVMEVNNTFYDDGYSQCVYVKLGSNGDTYVLFQYPFDFEVGDKITWKTELELGAASWTNFNQDGNGEWNTAAVTKARVSTRP